MLRDDGVQRENKQILFVGGKSLIPGTILNITKEIFDFLWNEKFSRRRKESSSVTKCSIL